MNQTRKRPTIAPLPVITSDEIRKDLRRFDGFIRPKISKTQAVLDRTYSLVPTEILQSYISKIRARWAGIDFNASGVSDCDNWALWMQSDFQQLWARNRVGIYEPAIFRVVVKEDLGKHAINRVYTDGGIKFTEPQTGEIWPDEKTKILAVT